MASQTASVVGDSTDYIDEIVSDLNQALDRLDMLGFTEAGAKLASVIDWLQAHVSDAPGNGPATQS